MSLTVLSGEVERKGRPEVWKRQATTTSLWLAVCTSPSKGSLTLSDRITVVSALGWVFDEDELDPLPGK
jgi:hypothetical protein